MTILIVINVDWFFCSHFMNYAKLLKSSGCKVIIACQDTGKSNLILDNGFQFEFLSTHRSSLSILSNIRYIFKLLRLCYKIQPDVIEFITIKPVIYGGILSRFFKLAKKFTVYYVSGLGYIFNYNSKNKLISSLVRNILYPFSLKGKSKRFIVENSSDKKKITEILKVQNVNIKQLNGVGVDLIKYKPFKNSSKIFTVTIVSRLLKDKGILEFCEVASMAAKKGLIIKFLIVGEIDEFNPMTLSKKEVLKLSKINNLNFLGYRSDIPNILSNSDIFLFPSYREGFSKALMEAGASGLPVIVFDVPGCRDAVKNKFSGFIVDFCDTDELFYSLLKLYENPRVYEKMSLYSRNYAEQYFNQDDISTMHVNFIKDEK